MQQPRTDHVNEVQVYSPLCPNCGAATALARIDPTPEPDHDQRIFICETCRTSEVVDVKFR